MPDFLARLIPISAALAGTYYGMARFDPIMDQVKFALVRSEVSSIARLISFELEAKDRPTVANFPAYVRENMYSTDKHRDLALDLWGRPYRLYQVNGAPTVGSAGPDGNFGTRDDIEGLIRPILD